MAPVAGALIVGLGWFSALQVLGFLVLLCLPAALVLKGNARQAAAAGQRELGTGEAVRHALQEPRDLPPAPGFFNWRELLPRLKQTPHVPQAAPALYGPGILTGPVQAAGATLKGLLPQAPVPDALRKLKSGTFNNWKPVRGYPPIVLGSRLAQGIEKTFGVKGRVHFNVGGAQAIEDALKLVPRHAALNLNLVQVILKRIEKDGRSNELIQRCKGCLERVSYIPPQHRQHKRLEFLKRKLASLG